MAADRVPHLAALQALGQLQAGWHEGEGLPLNPGALERLALLFRHYDRALPTPYVYPTLAGGVRLEWSLGAWEASLDISLKSLAAELHAVNVRTQASQEQALSLASRSGWCTLNDSLARLVG